MNTVRTRLTQYSSIQSYKTTARLLGISKNTVKSYVRRYESSGLEWGDIDNLSDVELSDVIYPQSIIPDQNRESTFDSPSTIVGRL